MVVAAPKEGDRATAPNGRRTTVYDLATCTETGQRVVVHGSRGHTFTTPLERFVETHQVWRADAADTR